jgi:4-diphosphocytidyl-2-C-methyl-D-erythritol kinase
MGAALNAAAGPAQLTLPAPAKLNRFLHVTGRRPDGYHTLQTVFQFVELSDTLALRRRDDAELRLYGDGAALGEDNLVLRAARLLQQRCGSPLGADLTVHKRIPMGGGLGGGSSDAASTLLGLDRLWDLQLPLDELARLGLELGADVPVFVHGRAAWAEGVGEQLTPVELDEPWYLLIHPGCAVNTAAIFADPDLTRNTPPLTISAFFRTGGHNDCEAVVRRRHSEVDQALTWLGNHTEARMTGTGSCVFGRFAGRAQAEAVRAVLPTTWRGDVTRGLNRSPAHLALYD